MYRKNTEMPFSSAISSEYHLMLKRAKQLLDHVYPEEHAEIDGEIQQFRESVLSQLEELRVRALTDVEATELKQLVQKMEKMAQETDINVPNSALSLIKIGTDNILGPNAQQTINVTINNPVLSFDQLTGNDNDEITIRQQLEAHYLSPEWQRMPIFSPEASVYPFLGLEDGINLQLSKQQLPNAVRLLQDTSVKVSDLFNDGESKAILIGEMGSGKTSFTRLLASKWAKGEWLKTFDYVFHLDLQDCLQQVDDVKNISCSELLQIMYTDKPIKNGDAMKKVLRGKKVLLIIDRYDEIVSRNPHLVRLFFKQNEYHCLFTSRPEMAQELLPKVDLIIKNSGVIAEKAFGYIRKYFDSLKKSRLGGELCDWLEQQPQLLKICSTPIYLEMLCRLWWKDAEKIKNNKDLSRIALHKEFIDSLIEEHMLYRSRPMQPLQGLTRSSLPEVILTRIFLEQLAFMSFQRGNPLKISSSLLLDAIEEVKNKINADRVSAYLPPQPDRAKVIAEELKKLINSEISLIEKKPEVTFFERIIASGILSLNIQGDSKNPETTCSFPQWSFCEYFTASYISKHLEDVATIAKYKYDPAWQLIWKMVAGILKDDAKRINLFFEILMSPPRDLYGIYETTLLAHCLNSCEWSNHLKPEYREAFREYLIKWLRASIEKIGISLPITSTFAEVINLEDLLRAIYKAERPHLKTSFFDRKEKKKNIRKLEAQQDEFIKLNIINMLCELDTLSDDSIDLLFEAWNGAHGLVYSAANKAIRRLAKTDVRVFRKILDQQGPGQIRPFSSEFVEINSKSGWEEILSEITDPSNDVIDHLLERMRKTDEIKLGYIANILGKLTEPTRKVILEVVGIIREFTETILKERHYLYSYKNDKNDLLYNMAIDIFYNWPTTHVINHLEEVEIETLLICAINLIRPSLFGFDKRFEKFLIALFKEKGELTQKLLLKYASSEDKIISENAIFVFAFIDNPTLEIVELLLSKCNADKHLYYNVSFYALIIMAETNGEKWCRYCYR